MINSWITSKNRLIVLSGFHAFFIDCGIIVKSIIKLFHHPPLAQNKKKKTLLFSTQTQKNILSTFLTLFLHATNAIRREQLHTQLHKTLLFFLLQIFDCGTEISQRERLMDSNNKTLAPKSKKNKLYKIG